MVDRTEIMLRRLNDALPGLVLGILVYGVLLELAGIWFVADKLRYSTGLAIGIALACGIDRKSTRLRMRWTYTGSPARRRRLS